MTRSSFGFCHVASAIVLYDGCVPRKWEMDQKKRTSQKKMMKEFKITQKVEQLFFKNFLEKEGEVGPSKLSYDGIYHMYKAAMRMPEVF